jgi:hypothetical protein
MLDRSALEKSIYCCREILIKLEQSDDIKIIVRLFQTGSIPVEFEQRNYGREIYLTLKLLDAFSGVRDFSIVGKFSTFEIQYKKNTYKKPPIEVTRQIEMQLPAGSKSMSIKMPDHGIPWETLHEMNRRQWIRSEVAGDNAFYVGDEYTDPRPAIRECILGWIRKYELWLSSSDNNESSTSVEQLAKVSATVAALSDRQNGIIRTLYQKKAFHPDQRLRRQELAGFLADSVTSAFGESVSRLTKIFGYTDSKGGRDGGVWLTESGKQYAETIIDRTGIESGSNQS